MIPIVLASASSRRRALLAALGLEFEVVVSNADEISDGDPAAIVVDNARAKCMDVVAHLESEALVIAADTLVFLGERIFGKPADSSEARQMLAALSGNRHQVLTGLFVADTAAGRNAKGYESTDVTFRDLSAREIARFVDAVDPVDRAGAYTVDGPGSLLVAGYGGCYQNVLGLPIVRLDMLLRELGYSLFELMDADRARFL